ncbi:MAG: acylphosphatase [Bacteroidia bacterium]|nr:acylphosphatase [Bacteroidia bacterium]
MRLRNKTLESIPDICIELTVTGSVQGVYYRKFTKELAVKLDIKGWVKNQADGSVLIVACGTQRNLDVFIEKCKEGNIWSKVSDVYVKSIQVANSFKSFEIVRKK